MATTINDVKVDFGLGAVAPTITFLQGADMTIPALQDAFRLLEESDEGKSSVFLKIISASGNEGFNEDGSEKNALTITVLKPYVMGFEAGPIPFQSGIGNLLGSFVDSPGAIVQVNNAVGSISLNSPAIEYSSFGGHVTVDLANGTAGTTYPIGTPRVPSGNLADAMLIAQGRGFTELFFIGNGLIDGGDDYTGMTFIGESMTKSHLTVSVAANVLRAEFYEAHILGTLDGESLLNHCVLDNIDYVSGKVENCVLEEGVITLGGNVQADFLNCWSGEAGSGTPCIDCGGSGQSLTVRNYSGGLLLTNKTGTNDKVSVDLVSGQVKVDLATMTAGEVVIRGTGKVIEYTTGAPLPSGSYGDLTLINETVSGIILQDIHGQVAREVWLDTSRVINGNGYQQNPFNNLTDAVDTAELNGITGLVVLDDVTLDRNLKNFSVRGVGVPTIDLAGYDLKGGRFYQVKLEGAYTDQIIAQDCVLLTNMYLNGFFDNCALAGDLICVDGGTVFMKSSASSIAGLGRPTISMNGAGSSKLSVRDHGGGLTIKDCNNPLDEVTVEMGQIGSLTFDASNTDGQMVARTNGKFVDLATAAGASVEAEAYTELGKDYSREAAANTQPI